MNRPHLRYTWISRIVLAASAVSVLACGSETTSTGAAVTDTVSDTATVTDTGGGGGSDTTTGGDTVKADAGKDIVKKDVQAPPDNDKVIDGAMDLVFAEPSSETLDPVGDVDYWKFTGKKGQIIAIYLEAQSMTTAFDADTLDTIMTVYGPDKKQLAFNDDPQGRTNNDSYINLVLPEDGTYYVRVEECWTWLNDHPQGNGVSCADPQEKGNVDYNINVVEWDKSIASFNMEAPGDNGAAAKAQEVAITKGQNGNYIGASMVGTFEGVIDIDVYHFAVPADATKQVTSGRPSIQADLDKPGTEGNGSTAKMGSVWLTSDTTPTVMLAMSDFATADTVSAPAPFGAGYFLFVSRVGGSPAMTANEYYWLFFGFGGSNPIETAESANDAAAGAEATKQEKTTTGDAGFYLEGDLIGGAKDTDWWKINVPAGTEGGKFYVFCAAQSVGSGLRDLKAEIFTDATTPLAGGSATEKPDGLSYGDAGLTIPAAGGTLYLKLTAGSQAADVTSSYYRCGSVFRAP